MGNYRAYLQSDHWKNLRLEKLVKAGTLCHFCRTDSIHNDVHHVKYPKNLKDTKLRHLRVLFRSCHELCHNVLEEFPAIKKLGSTSHIWRVTEQHVRKKLGMKISFPKDDVDGWELEQFWHKYTRKQLRSALLYATISLRIPLKKSQCPFSAELADWYFENSGASFETLLLMASILAKTGLTLRQLTKVKRKKLWKRWRASERMRNVFPEHDLPALPQPLSWKDLHPQPRFN